jgi:ribonuclease P protein component
MEETYGPQERIRKKRDFLSLYRNGNRFKGKYIVLIYLFNDIAYSRMSVVVSKKHGNAVRRNKIKRQLRTLFRRNKRQLRTLFRRNKILLGKSIDFLIIPKKEMQEATWTLLEEDYQRAVRFITGTEKPQ